MTKKLEIVSGGAGAGKTYYCLSRVAEIMKREPLGAPLIVLVPEHDTYRVERELCALMGEDNGCGYVRAHVVGFRRLAHRVFEATGEEPARTITELGRQLIIKRILLARENEFTSFGKNIRQSGFVGELSALVAEFKSYDVMAAYEKNKDREIAEHLRAKLEDIRRVIDAYDEALRGTSGGERQTAGKEPGDAALSAASGREYSDEEELMSQLLALIPTADFFNGAQVWVDGFVFFEPLELKVLQAMAERGCPLTVTLALDEAAWAGEELSVFSRQRQTYGALKKLAGGAVFHRILDGEPLRFLGASRAAFARLAKELFSFAPVKGDTGAAEPPDVSRLRLAEAANRRQEVELMAADIRRLCREDGYHYSDIAVLVRDWDAYGFLLPLILADYDIPSYSDKKISALDHPLAELILAALRIFTDKRGGWRYESVFRALKTGFFAATADEIDRLENYAVEFGIQGSRWTADEPRPYRRKSRDGEFETDAAITKYWLAIKIIRMRVVAPLANFGAAIGGETRSVRELSQAVYDFLKVLGVPGKLQEWADEQTAAGCPEKARRHEQMWNQVVKLLDDLTMALGDEKLGGEPLPALKEYVSLLTDGLGRIKFSLTPPGVDCVTIATVDSNSLDNIRAVYILGVNDGIMPRPAPEPGFISRAEREELAARLGIALPGHDRAETAIGERYALYRAFTRMRDYLWISYSLADDAGEGLLPSSLVLRLESLFPALRLEKFSVGDGGLLSVGGGAEKPYLWQLANERQAVVKLAGVLREMRKEPADRQLSKAERLWPRVYDCLLSDGLPDAAPEKLLAKVIDGLFITAGESRLVDALARRLYLTAGDVINGSISSLQDYYRCPFSYFAKRGLKLKKRREFSFDFADKGNLLHSVAENFIRAIFALGNDKLSAVNCSEYAKELTKQAARDVHNSILLQDYQMEGLLKRLTVTAEVALTKLKEFVTTSHFSPLAVELPFGLPASNGGPALAKYALQLENGVTLALRGRIDRVDKLVEDRDGYVLVIDYKTGSKKVALADIYDGQNLQLITYLMLACRLKTAELADVKLMPAGMYYFYLQNPIVAQPQYDLRAATDQQNDELAMKGWTLDDEKISGRISGDSETDDPTEREKDKAATRQFVRGQRRSAEFFALAARLAENRLAAAAGNILRGDMAARPYYRNRQDVACAYCDYRAVCGFDIQVAGFERNLATKEKEAKLVERIKAELEAGATPESEGGRK